MTDENEQPKERPLRERVFSWEEFKAGWRYVRGHASDDEDE
jgi:hypothetical protein